MKQAEETTQGEKKDEKEKENPSKEKTGEGRDWRRNVQFSDERWLEWLDSKVALLINREGVDVHDYGGKSYPECVTFIYPLHGFHNSDGNGYNSELTKAVEPHIKQEDEGKFRCKTCQKLFKATSFVEKHIANKHGELVKQLDDVCLFSFRILYGS